VQGLLGLPLLPPGDIVQELQDVTMTIDSDDQFSQQLHQLVALCRPRPTLYCTVWPSGKIQILGLRTF